MKNFVIAILSICLIGSVILNFAIISRNEKPSEMVAEKAVVQVVEDEGEGHYRYEIVTEDGNLWVVYGDGYEKVGDHLVVVFYTFNSTDLTEWDVLDFWKTTDGE